MSTLESYGGSWIISMEKEHELYLRKVKRDKWKVRAIRILILVAFIALWEIAAQLKWIDPFLTSSPSRIIKSLVSFINEGTLFRHIWVTCYETIIGFTLGTVLGVAIAILLWASKTASKVLDPYLVVLNALPKVALAPIIIFWVGNGTSAIITIALLISIVTTIISVLTGFNEVDKGAKIKIFSFSSFCTSYYFCIKNKCWTFLGRSYNGRIPSCKRRIGILNNIWWTNSPIRYGYDEYSNSISYCFYNV